MDVSGKKQGSATKTPVLVVDPWIMENGVPAGPHKF